MRWTLKRQYVLRWKVLSGSNVFEISASSDFFPKAESCLKCNAILGRWWWCVCECGRRREEDEGGRRWRRASVKGRDRNEEEERGVEWKGKASGKAEGGACACVWGGMVSCENFVFRAKHLSAKSRESRFVVGKIFRLCNISFEPRIWKECPAHTYTRIPHPHTIDTPNTSSLGVWSGCEQTFPDGKVKNARAPSSSHWALRAATSSWCDKSMVSGSVTDILAVNTHSCLV